MDDDLTYLPLMGPTRDAIMEKAPLDQWIALSHDQTRMVASSSSFNDAVSMSEAAGELDPIMIKTPPFWGEAVGFWPDLV